MSSCNVLTGPAQDDPPGTVTLGQLAAKPICAGVRSSPPPQALSAPPHALQMAATFFCSAAAIAAAALPSPGLGHGFECLPFSRASQHFWSAFDFAAKNLAALLPIAFWQALRAWSLVLGRFRLP